MRKRRTIKAVLTAATIAVAVALPVSTASAATAGAATVSPQDTVITGPYPTYEDCTYEGSTLMFTAGSTGYDCVAVDGGYQGYLLYSYY